MNKKIIDFYNEHSINICFVICAIILTGYFFSEINYIGSRYIFNIVYPTSRFVVYKFIFFIACPLAIFVTLWLYKWDERDFIKIVILLIGYSFLHTALQILPGHLQPVQSILEAEKFGVIPIVLFYPAFSIYNRAINFRYTKYIVFVSALFVAILPTLVGHHLNSESYFQPDIFKHLTVEEKKITIEFTLKNPREIAMLNKRITKNPYLSINQIALPYIIDRSHEDQNRITVGIGNDLASYCYFLKINSNENENSKNFYKCIDALDAGSMNTIFAKIKYIHLMPAFNNEIQNKFLEKIDEFLGNKNKWRIGDNQNLLKLMLVKGAIFHHYDSIADGINDVGFTAFYNQYGLGPIFVTKLIGKIFNLTTFDAIFYSIVFINIILLVIIIILFRLDSYILFGYIASILSVFFVANDLAAFLYFIRYLPTTLLCLTIAKFGISNFKISALCLIECLLLLICSIYNKEYGLLTATAIILTGIISKDYKFCLRALWIVLPLAFFLAVIPSAHVNGANFIALLSGVGYDASPKPDSILVFSLLLYLFFYFVYHSVNNKPILFILLLLGLFSVKYVTNTSINHFGPLFLYVFLVIYLLKKANYCTEKYSIYFPCFCTLIMLCLAAPNLKYLYMEQKFKRIEYKSNHISHRFFIDKSLLNLGTSLINLNLNDHCIIAQQDDFLKIFTQQYLTSNLPNLSTNINFPVDAYKALQNYKGCKYIVIENSLLNNALDDFLLGYIYNRDDNMNKYILGYINERSKLKNYIRMATSNRLYAFSNREFTVYQ